MTETIITEDGEIKISQTQETPQPVKTGLAIMLRSITRKMDQDEDNLNAGQDQLDRICSQLLPEHWNILAETQIRIIAVRNVDAANYLATLPK